MRVVNYYEALGIAPAATYGEIRKAYRRLAKQYHPDKNPNAAPERQERFIQCAEAYAVLSNLKKRKRYDDALFNTTARQGSFRFTQPHYSGYPYFQYDIFTPFFHSFFMGGSPKTQKKRYRAFILNYRILLVAALGALLFFKFFDAMEGVVVEKKIKAGLFNNVSYYLTLKNDRGTEKKKRVKSAVYDAVEKGDRVEKKIFSFTYAVNDEKIAPVNTGSFILQMGMIYAFVCGGLFFLEYSRS